MTDTKENILMTSLRLFAQDGYEAVSVSKIAGELGMTKGALYKHYKNKRAIFDSIFERLCRLDIERSKEAGMPEQKVNEVPVFQSASVESVKAYMVSQFYYWTEDETACNFRKMLTLEQYRNPEMTKLYQKVLTGGPVSFVEALFHEMMEQGTLRSGSPRQMAVEFFAPFYLLLSLSDAAPDKEEKKKINNLFLAHIDCFTGKYAAEEP
ncbi:TetR/AcrR family transcriptional regulator [Clostridium transplantifaecale]|uniref:TetR/AcrR family transcriptional regulator n=1 Tax=Clostridium transplantifaecale TaxID=2479838 RepID=UPI000F62FDC4|nr:TetR/AcrR family transcriptional regulator [Clostridium transplantifaecale]